MCGRFTLTADVTQIQASFPWINIPPGLQPRYNIAPTQPVAVVANDGQNRLDFFTWGLVPSWAKDPSIGSRMINARSETLAEKPSFRNAFRRRRCLILADGFYEWHQAAKGQPKVPIYIRFKDHRPFAFAGLWERWQSPDGSEILSSTIITTRPNKLVENYHNRMPVILPEESYPQWLDPGEGDPRQLSALLGPHAESGMMAYPVSRMVNNPSHESPDLINPAQ
jgi:putative SOS response-associated peptidase YedK